MPRLLPLLVLPLIVVPFAALPAAEPPTDPPPTGWPMYGGSPSRNMANFQDQPVLREVSAEKGIILWKADLGSGGVWAIRPGELVVGNGKILIGTNNDRPRNKRDIKVTKDPDTGEVEKEPIDKGILLCFDAATGKFLWQAVHDKLPGGIANDWPHNGLCSTPTIEGDRAYYVSNQCRIVCVDMNGFADGNQGFQGEKYKDATDADILWEFDMIKELGVFPHSGSPGCPLIVGDMLFANTGNGVGVDHTTLPAPDAPSFIALDKNTGKLLWKDNSPGKTIQHTQWSSPCYTVDPVPQVIFAGGDGWLRAFEPKTGKLLWKFDCNPKDAVHEVGGDATRNEIVGLPVVAGGRVFVGTGSDAEHTSGIAWFWCVDLKRAIENAARNADRDVSRDLIGPDVKQPNGAKTVGTKPNPDSALAWVFGGAENRQWREHDYRFSRTMSTACVVGGVVYIPDLTGNLHCLDAKTGKQFWEYDTKALIRGSAFYADGKVFVANEQGELYVFRHDPKPDTIDALDFTASNSKEAKAKRNEKRREVERKYLMQKITLDYVITTTPIVADGVLYVATDHTLYAIGKK